MFTALILRCLVVLLLSFPIPAAQRSEPESRHICFAEQWKSSVLYQLFGNKAFFKVKNGTEGCWQLVQFHARSAYKGHLTFWSCNEESVRLKTLKLVFAEDKILRRFVCNSQEKKIMIWIQLEYTTFKPRVGRLFNWWDIIGSKNWQMGALQQQMGFRSD